MKNTSTIKEVSKLLGVAEATVRKLVNEGEIPSIRISPRRIIIPNEMLNRWMEARANADHIA
ncbi:MAG: helix-turn-helix domain-containing protein [Clostridiales bacterium]|nr:helix-turn-helix domain-containing protein [Clostridiales bacterium]